MGMFITDPSREVVGKQVLRLKSRVKEGPQEDIYLVELLPDNSSSSSDCGPNSGAPSSSGGVGSSRSTAGNKSSTGQGSSSSSNILKGSSGSGAGGSRGDSGGGIAIGASGQPSSLPHPSLDPPPAEMLLKVMRCSSPSEWEEAKQRVLREYNVPRAVEPEADYLLVSGDMGYISLGDSAAGIKLPCLLLPRPPLGTLEDYIQNVKGRGLMIPADLAAYLVACLIRGAAVLHEAGWIHRNINPGNIFLFGTSWNPIPKLTGFGIAAPISNISSAFGVNLGRLFYQPPEMLFAGHLQNAGTDMEMCGRVYLAMRWGEVPYWYLVDQAGDTLEVKKQKILDLKDPLKELQSKESPYNQAIPNGPQPLTAEEMSFLGKCMSPMGQERFTPRDMLMHGKYMSVSYFFAIPLV